MATATKPLLTYGFNVLNVEEIFYSPDLRIPQYPDKNLYSIYCFLSSVDPWPDDANPPDPTDDALYLKKALKNMFVARRILSSDMTPVVQRIDWTANTVYDFYRDDINLFEEDQNGFLIYNFYVKNKYDQVFKCLWNQNDTPSNDEPFFEPDTFNTSVIYYGTDGYKWKYIYTLETAKKIKFLDDNWMPISADITSPNPLTSPAGYGNIEVINVLNHGESYDETNASIQVVITGDGFEASALPIVEANGTISDIIVTNAGKNYTYANAQIISDLGSNAVCISPVSPIGGHGTNPISELGCKNVMITSQFSYDEGGLIPTDISYHQVGILINPTSYVNSPFPANGIIYKTSTDAILTSGLGDYISGETVYQGDTLLSASFTATVLSWDTVNDICKLINITGQLTSGVGLVGNTSATIRTVVYYDTPIFVPISGTVAYLENRSAIERSEDGIEQFKLVIEY